jgi:ubiquinone/menaquinone biosynthesis C-methylase UbiE
MKPVDWTAYAREYDRMSEHNPAYHELLAHCQKTIAGWPMQTGDMLADIGAGTGNFSVALARVLPDVQVIHTDFNDEMLAIARCKADGLANWQAIALDVRQDDWPLPALAGIVSVHALYAFPNPRRVIGKMAAQLRPGGFIYACDVGRVLNIRDWTWYLVKESMRAHGLPATLGLFCRGQEIRRQNQAVVRGQKHGTYWTHNLTEFRAMFEAAGIEVLSATDAVYRGYDDLIVGRKPEVK